MLFHGRQDADLALYSASVVIADVILNHIDQSFLAVEPLTVVAFPLEDTAITPIRWCITRSWTS